MTDDAIMIRGRPAHLKMTYEEFLDWADEDTHAEWVNGEVIVFMPTKPRHQRVVSFLLELLGTYVGLFKLGELLSAPIEMRAQPGGSSREPDILFIAQENLSRLTEDRLAGPADLIVEVISDDSVRRDRSHKFKEYQQAGVREYWIIDPRPGKQRADFYRLNDSGEYELAGTEDDERVESAVLFGFWLRPSWLWQVPNIEALSCLLEIEHAAEALARRLAEHRQGEQDANKSRLS